MFWQTYTLFNENAQQRSIPEDAPQPMTKLDAEGTRILENAGLDKDEWVNMEKLLGEETAEERYAAAEEELGKLKPDMSAEEVESTVRSPFYFTPAEKKNRALKLYIKFEPDFFAEEHVLIEEEEGLLKPEQAAALRANGLSLTVNKKWMYKAPAKTVSSSGLRQTSQVKKYMDLGAKNPANGNRMLLVATVLATSAGAAYKFWDLRRRAKRDEFWKNFYAQEKAPTTESWKGTGWTF